MGVGGWARLGIGRVVYALWGEGGVSIEEQTDRERRDTDRGGHERCRVGWAGCVHACRAHIGLGVKTGTEFSLIAVKIMSKHLPCLVSCGRVCILPLNTTVRYAIRHSLRSQGGEGGGQVEALRRPPGIQAEEVETSCASVYM